MNTTTHDTETTRPYGRQAADMWLALTDALRTREYDHARGAYLLKDGEDMERLALALASLYEHHRASAGPGAIILDPITIREAIDDVKTTHGWTEDGWTEDDHPFGPRPTTLTALADWWAEQEANESPDDRASLEAWLADHIDDDIITPPRH